MKAGRSRLRNRIHSTVSAGQGGQICTELDSVGERLSKADPNLDYDGELADWAGSSRSPLTYRGSK